MIMIDSINSFDENDSIFWCFIKSLDEDFKNARAGQGIQGSPACEDQPHPSARIFAEKLIPSPNEKHPPNEWCLLYVLLCVIMCLICVYYVLLFKHPPKYVFLCVFIH